MAKRLSYNHFLSKVSKLNLNQSENLDIWTIYQRGTKLQYIGLIKQHYDVGITVGRGSSGFVKIGKNKKTGRMSALKFMKETKVDADELIKEYDLMSKLSMYPKCNQYIICYEDLFKASYGKIGNIYYILKMELFRGQELLELVECKNATLMKIEAPYLKLIIRDILEGLAFLHAKNIAHRDIKLNNVMFDSKHIKLVDFGFACTIDMCANKKGTHIYFAPEKARMGTNYSHKTVDIWATGIMLLEMITNYDISETLFDMIDDVDTKDTFMNLVTDILGSKPEIPKDVYILLTSLLEYYPEARPSTQEALKLIKGDIGTYEGLWKFWKDCEEEKKSIYF